MPAGRKKNINNDKLYALSPFVRFVKIARHVSLAGEWLDYDHVFTYIEQGEALFILGGETYPVREGDAVLIPPLVPHIIRSTSEVPLIQYIFHFDCQYTPERSQWTEIGWQHWRLAEVPARELLFAPLHPVARIRTIDAIELKKIFLHMLREFEGKRHVYPLRLKAGALELLALFLRSQAGRPERRGEISSSWPIIEKCITIIREQYADAGLGNLEIGRLAGVSPSHMSYLFQKELGISVHSYLTHVRIDHAKRLMLEGGNSLTNIAELSGFSGIHHFSRIFKTITGMTATQFKAANAGKPQP